MVFELLAIAQLLGNMPQDLCSPRNPGCVPAGWVVNRGSGRDVARRCTGGDCRGEFPEDRVGLLLMVAGLWV